MSSPDRRSLPLRTRTREAWGAVRAELRAGRPQERSPRGVALLLVLVVLAILGSFTAEYHYKSYVRLHVAANLRDDVIAYYHARSAMEVARLVIKSQNVADNMMSAIAAFVPNIKNQNIELWTFACQFANAFCTGELKLMGKTFFNFSGMEGVGVERGGMCRCRAEPEDGRININRVDTAQDKTQRFFELYTELRQHSEQPQLDPREIDEELAETVLNIIDHADPDTNRSDLVGMMVQEGSAGEGAAGALERKDAKYDTLEELQLVEGMTPDLFCKISERLTPYSTRKLNVNTASLSTLRGLLCQHMTNAQEVCYAPGGQLAGMPIIDYSLFCMNICRSLRQALMSPGFGNPKQFLDFFSKLPGAWEPRPQLDARAMGQKIGVKSRVIRIETVGGSYGTYRTLTAVIDTSTGDYVYWREY